MTYVTDPDGWSEDSIGALYNGILAGPIYVNGVNQRAGLKTYDPLSMTDGSPTITTVTVPRARLGRDIPLVMFSNSL